LPSATATSRRKPARPARRGLRLRRAPILHGQAIDQQVWERYASAEQPLKAWYALMRHREFRSPNELKAEFGTVSLLPDGHACFNVGGNKFRLVVHVRYDLGIIFVKRVLTHEEYDVLNAAGTLIEGRKDR
jgi:mRNA interferase HigB